MENLRSLELQPQTLHSYENKECTNFSINLCRKYQYQAETKSLAAEHQKQFMNELNIHAVYVKVKQSQNEVLLYTKKERVKETENVT